MSLKTELKRSLPPPIFNAVRRLYHAGFRRAIRPWCELLRVREAIDPWLKAKLAKSTSFRLPPPLLRFRIGEETDPFAFLAIGETLCGHLDVCLQTIGARFEDFPHVLDFGCGCGRTLMHLMHVHPGHQFAGVDVDREAIAWCAGQLAPAAFFVNGQEPPLPFPAESFDLIYGISVFTHIDKSSQQQWVAELERLLRPGGALILTVNGEAAAKHAGVDTRELAGLAEEGVKFLSCRKLTGIHPEWYQTSFNDRRYTEALFQRSLCEVRYIEKIFGWQDAVVARKGAALI